MKAAETRSIQPRTGLNRILASGFIAFTLFQMILLPLFLLPRSASWLWSLGLMLLVNNTLWSLFHESIHGNLDRKKSVNHRWGRALAICYGSSFALLRPIHLLHHRVSRTVMERPDVLEGSRRTLGLRLMYYFNLLGGLYLQQFLLPVVALYPKRVLRSLTSAAYRPDSFLGSYFSELLQNDLVRREGAIDALVLYSLTILGFYLYGAQAWALALFMGLRAFQVSFLDYAYHYQAPLEDPRHGYNLALPTVVSKWILHFNYHGIHHQNPSVPWHALPRVSGQLRAQSDGTLVDSALRQLKGPRISLLQ